MKSRKALSMLLAIIMLGGLLSMGLHVNAANTYTVIFDSNGGTPVPSQTVKAGECPTTPEKPTKMNYRFNYWSKDGKAVHDLSSLSITENTTLVAKWYLPVVVSYGLYGEVGSSTSASIEPSAWYASYLQQSVDEGEVIYYWAKPNDGYVFKGWQNLSDGRIISTSNPIRFTPGDVSEFRIMAVYEAIPALEGTVTISQTDTSNGITLTANLSGAAANIPADKLHYDWRYVVTTDVYGRIRPTGGTYKTLTLPQGDYSTRRYFVYVTADGYEGYLQSGYVKIDAGSSSYPKGDVDRSGQVGNSDLILVARHVVHLVTLTGEQFTLGDMDDDKQITNTDIILVARRIVGL